MGNIGYDGSLKFDTSINAKGFNSGIKKLGSIAKTGVKTVAGAVTGVATAMGFVASASVKVGSDFEAQMSKVQAISGATGEDLEKLSEKAKEMGATTKFSATESGQAMEYMAMAGWKTEDMLNGLGGIMNLAAASGEDLATTSDIVTDALTAFGMTAKDSGHFADILATASSNANTNVGMMGETFKYVAPVAGALGYTAEDTAVAIGLMANSGIKAGQAGTSLRGIMSRMAKPTKEVRTAMKKLGVSLTDSSGNMNTLDEVMHDLRKGFSGLSEAEAAEMATSLAGQEAMSGLLAIVNASEGDFNKLKDAIYSAEGASTKMAETMQNNLQGKLTILKSSAEGLGIELYESMQEPLSGITQIGIDSLNKLTEAFKTGGTQGLISAGGQIISDILLGIAQSIPSVVTTAVDAITSLVQNMTAHLPQFLSAGSKILQALIQGMFLILPALGEFVFALATQLYTQIRSVAPTLLQKGYELLSNLVDGFVKAIPEALPKVLDFVQGIGEKLAEAAPILMQKGFELLQKLVEGIIAAIPILIARVPEIISTFANIINDNFPTILMKGAELLGQLIMGLINAIPTLIANIPKIIDAIVDTLMAFQWLNLGKNIIKFLGDGINGMVSYVKKAGKNILDAIKNAILNLPSTLANIGKNAMSGLGNALSAAIGFVKSAASRIVGGIVDTISSIPGKMLSIGKNIVQGLWNGISDMTGWVISKIKGFGESVLGGIKSFFGIKSPSRLMRDEVGKYLAQGVGIGFEKNIPIKQMTSSMKKAIGNMQATAVRVTSIMPMAAKFATKAVTNNYTDMQIDYKEVEKAQLRAMNQSNQRPVLLNGRQINRALKEGGYVLA